jgi:hypothetical protein
MSVATETIVKASREAVVHHLARKIYLAHCEHRGWKAYPWPYVDNGSIRSAEIAVDFLGFEDDVLDGGES